MPEFMLHLLGEPKLCVDGVAVPCRGMVLRLLAVLALDGACERLRVADLLWEGTSAKVLHNLRVTLQHLRKSLGVHAGIVRSRKQFLELDLAQVWVDALSTLQSQLTAGQFMQGYRTSGSESWLEWAEQTEQRLCERQGASPAHAAAKALLVSSAVSAVQALPYPALHDQAEGRAALNAYRLHDTVSAERQAREILITAPKGPNTALALDVLANLALDRGEYQRGRTYAEQAFWLHPQPCSEVAYTAAYANSLLGHNDRAAQMARSALQTLPAADSPALLYSILGRSCDWRKQHRAARHWHELALESARAYDCPYVLPQVISFMLWHLNITGEAQRTSALAQDGLAYGAPSFAPYLTGSMGFSALVRGDWDAAFAHFYTQSQSGNITRVATGHSMTALALHHLGQRSEAEDHLLAGRELLELTENGNVRFEWGVAALTINARLWGCEAAQVVAGAKGNNPIPQDWYDETRERNLN